MKLHALKRVVSLALASALLLSAQVAGRAQSPPALRAGSGINSADTYLIADLTVHNSMTLSLAQAVHDNSTNTDTTSLPLDPPDKHYHVEGGYDANDHTVFNVYSTDPPADPTMNLVDTVGTVRVVNGQATVYDQAGGVMPNAIPKDPSSPTARSASASQALSLLGVLPGPSIVDYFICPDPTFCASEDGGSPQTSGATSVVSVPVHSVGGGTSTLTYQQQSASVWTLQQIALSRSTPTLQISSSVLVSGLGWVKNSSGDTRRRALTHTAGTAPSSSTLNPPTPALSGADTTTPQNVQSFTAAGQNVVFQHGIFSSGKTWNRMRGWLDPIFEFGKESVPNLPSTDKLGTQATDLVNLLNGGQNDSVLIGHSNGGLIARDVAQRRPDLAQGVATVDSPHLGVLLDQTGRQQLADALKKGIIALASAAGCTAPDDNPGCAIADFLANFSFPVVNWALDSAIPASTDDKPGSVYLNNLNANAENFVRVGIEGHANKRWVLMRLGGDFISNPDDLFGGRNIALATQVAYIGFRTCEFLALLYGFFDIAAFCGGIADTMDAIDRFWDKLTAPGDSSDGIVQGASQHYPNATASYVISGADSHVGATRSDKTRDRLINALDRQFFVPRAGCTFLLSPASTSFAGQGGSGSVAINTAVNTPSACAWSAVSDVPWITLTSSRTGVGTGTIGYSVAANPSVTTGRTGTVSISGLQFTVTQTPFPDFQLSVTPTSQTVRAGSSITYSVSGTALNGFNGPVSLSAAVSPAGPGASLSAGSIQVSPSGSGTSTLTLSPSASTTPGSYAVTVTGTGGGQTHSAAVALTVNPPPSVATGSLSVLWTNNCDPSNTCSAGTVSVQIGGSLQGNTCYSSGLTESVPYDSLGVNGASDGPGVANEIAAAINGDANSPVTASVVQGSFGYTNVNLVSKTTGADQNFLVDITITNPNGGMIPQVSPPAGSGPGSALCSGSVGYLTGGA
jgi:pimeloyl-ACP methyl ester carboxylesterase